MPSALEACLQAVPDPQQLRAVLQYNSTLGHADLDGTRNVGGGGGVVVVDDLRIYPLMMAV